MHISAAPGALCVIRDARFADAAWEWRAQQAFWRTHVQPLYADEDKNEGAGADADAAPHDGAGRSMAASAAGRFLLGCDGPSSDPMLPTQVCVCVRACVRACVCV